MPTWAFESLASSAYAAATSFQNPPSGPPIGAGHVGWCDLGFWAVRCDAGLPNDRLTAGVVSATGSHTCALLATIDCPKDSWIPGYPGSLKHTTWDELDRSSCSPWILPPFRASQTPKVLQQKAEPRRILAGTADTPGHLHSLPALTDLPLP